MIDSGTLYLTHGKDHLPPRWGFEDFAPVWKPEQPYTRGWSIRDEYGAALSAFRAKDPQIRREIVKSIMVD